MEEILNATAHTMYYFVGSVYAAAAVSKMRGLARFVEAVKDYGLVSGRAVRPTAIGIFAGESLVAGGLLFSIFIDGLLTSALCFSGITALAMLMVIRSGRMIDCGCFGSVGGQVVGWFTVTRSVLLGSIVLWLLYIRSHAGWEPAPLEMAWEERLTLLVLVACLWVLVSQAHIGLSIAKLRGFTKLVQYPG